MHHTISVQGTRNKALFKNDTTCNKAMFNNDTCNRALFNNDNT